MCKQIRMCMNMITRERKRTNNIHRKVQKNRTKYTPPFYPVVDIPVPDLDWNKLRRKNSPWYLRLLVSIILLKCCKRNFLGFNKKEYNL